MIVSKDQKVAMRKILKDCIKYGETAGIDTPTAINVYIEVRKGEIRQEEEKIEKAKLKIETIKARKALAGETLINFWVRETDKRKQNDRCKIPTS